MNKNRISLILVIIATIDVSFAAIFIRLCLTSYIIIAFYRLLFSVLILFPLIFIGKNLTKIKLIIKKDLMPFIIIGISLGLHFLFWNLSLNYTIVANSVFLVNTSPIIVSIISHFYFKEKITTLQWLGVILSIIGGLIITIKDVNLGIYWLGDIFAILGAVMLAIYLLGGRKMRNDHDVIPYVVMVYLIATTSLFFIVMIMEGSIIIVSMLDIIFILGLAIISTIFGHTIYNYSLKRISAPKISTILLGEPVLSTIFAILFLNETPKTTLVIGGIIIILGILMVLKIPKNEN